MSNEWVGTYECNAANKLGQDKQIFEVKFMIKILIYNIRIMQMIIYVNKIVFIIMKKYYYYL